jgi:hypothetical protein
MSYPMSVVIVRHHSNENEAFCRIYNLNYSQIREVRGGGGLNTTRKKHNISYSVSL